MKRIIATVIALSLILSLFPTTALATGQSKKPITPRELKNVILIHYAKPDGKPVKKPPQPPPEDKVYTNYQLLGPKWSNLPVSYVIDPDYGPDGAAEEVYKAFEAWDDATSAELYNDNYIVDPNAGPSTQIPDLENVVCWRVLAGYPNAIAVTSYWYEDKTNDGPSTDDVMWDCDVIFNLKYKWGIDPDGDGPIKLRKRYFDVCNIATHEAGHVTGLADLYDEVDSEMTMYGYSKAGETKKISLELGDKYGTRELYGE